MREATKHSSVAVESDSSPFSDGDPVRLHCVKTSYLINPSANLMIFNINRVIIYSRLQEINFIVNNNTHVKRLVNK